MKKFIFALGVLSVLATSPFVYSDNTQSAFGGVETLACDFVDGKDMDDFMKVVQKWDKWATGNFSRNYSFNEYYDGNCMWSLELSYHEII